MIKVLILAAFALPISAPAFGQSQGLIGTDVYESCKFLAFAKDGDNFDINHSKINDGIDPSQVKKCYLFLSIVEWQSFGFRDHERYCIPPLEIKNELGKSVSRVKKEIRIYRNLKYAMMARILIGYIDANPKKLYDTRLSRVDLAAEALRQVWPCSPPD